MPKLRVGKANLRKATYEIRGRPELPTLEVSWRNNPRRFADGRVTWVDEPKLTLISPSPILPNLGERPGKTELNVLQTQIIVHAWNHAKNQAPPTGRSDFGGSGFDQGWYIKVPRPDGLEEPGKVAAGYKNGKLLFLDWGSNAPMRADAERIALLEHAMRKHQRLFAEYGFEGYTKSPARRALESVGKIVRRLKPKKA